MAQFPQERVVSYLKIEDLCLVIPAQNEGKVIVQTIASVLLAGLSAEHIYVVDDGSTDDTADKTSKYPVNLLRNSPNLGKTRSLERAIKDFHLCEKYKYISVLDADTQVDKNYFENVLRCLHSDKSIAAVCGQNRSVPCNWLTAYRSIEYLISLNIYKGAQSKLDMVIIAPGCSSTYRSDVFAAMEWPPESMNVEDTYYTTWVHRKRIGKIRYEPTALVHTQDPKTIPDYIRQINRWYSGAWQIMIKFGIPFGLQRIDAEWGFLMGEGLIYTSIIVIVPILLLFSLKLALSYFLIDFIILVFFAIMVAVRDHRIDVIKNLPRFFVPRYLNAIVFLVTFFKIVILRKKTDPWFSPSRY